MNKTAIILSLILVVANGFGQVPNYFENEPVWRENCSFDDFDNCIHNSARQIYLNGDTAMSNGQAYKQLLISSDNWYQNLGSPFGCEEPFFSIDYYASLRQSGDSIFQYLNNQEVLAFHFNFEAGDTIQGAYYYENGGTAIVSYIDSIQTMSGWFRRFNLTSSSGGYSEYLIEGIGHQYGFLGPLTTTVNGICELSCYRQNEVYQFGPDLECSTISSLEDFSGDLIQVYPNPASEGAVVVDLSGLSRLEIESVTLFAMDGRIVFETRINNETREILNLRHLRSGLYTLLVVSNQGNASKTLVIE